jgi:hypothetical protein
VVGAFAQCTILFAREVLNIQMRSRTRTISSEISFALRSGLALPVPAGVLEGALAATAAAAQAANDPKKQKVASDKRFNHNRSISSELHATTLPRASTLAHATSPGLAVMRGDGLLRAHPVRIPSGHFPGALLRSSSKKFNRKVT